MMKKICVFVIIILLFFGCRSPIIGKNNYFIVTKVETYSSAYRYKVTFRTIYSKNWKYYCIITDDNYCVGDTLKLSLK